MFGTVPVSVKETSADEQIKERETIAQQLNNFVKEQEIIEPSCNDARSQDLFGSRASNDSELEGLMFGTVTDAVKEPSTDEQMKRNKTSIKQLTDFVKETQEVVEPCNEAFSQDLFSSCAKTDSELENEDYSILDDLLTT